MEPLYHLLIPPIILLAIFPKINKRLFLTLLPLTIIMDFDIFLGAHRLYFHNIFIVLIVSVIAYFTAGKLGKLASLISAYFLTSHLILDIRMPGVALFYPLYKKFIYATSNITEYAGKLTFDFGIKLMTVQEVFARTPTHYYYSELVTMIILVIFLAIAIKLVFYYQKQLKK